MAKYFDRNIIISVFLVSAGLVNCIPSSVLVNSKVSNTADNNKVKRASNLEPTGEEIGKHFVHPDEKKTSPQKRGTNSQFHRFIPENNIYASEMSNGYYDDTESGRLYPGINALDEYQPIPIPLSYRPKNNAYDNLQRILNEKNNYEEPMALPLTYPAYPRYFPDRKKRSDTESKYSKLSPLEMIALLELVQDPSRMDSINRPNTNNNLDFQNSPYELPEEEDNGEWWNTNTFAEPSVQVYPFENNYDIDSRYGGQIERQQNYYPSKRFMVAKRKRSPNNFDRNFDLENLRKNSAGTGGFDSRSISELNNGGSEKQHAKYF